MISKHDDLLGTLIHDVAHLLRLEIDRRVAVYNLTRTKWLAISVLRDRPGVSQSELAKRLELGAAATGKLIDRLADRGFVVRKADETDRRTNTLHLTVSAQELLANLETEAGNLRREILDGFSAEETSALQNGLLKLKDRLKSSGASR